MVDFFRLKKTKSPLLVCEYDGDACHRLLNEQLGYIAKVCEKVVCDEYSGEYKSSLFGDGGTSYRIERQASLDADELFVHVVDHLRDDDYRRLREFQGRSSITTYLTAIIGRLVVDIVRQRTGRNRAKERAESHGELGHHVYDLMQMGGHTADESTDILLTNFSIQTSADELRAIHSSLLGRDTRHQSCANTETAWGEGGEFVVIQRNNPEMELMSHMQDTRRGDVLAVLIEELKGEERLLLRLRFPLDNETPPLDMEQIAAMTGLSLQQADRKLRYILKSCREKLLSKGLCLDDLL